MFIKCLKVGPLPTNCYIVCDTVAGKAVIIDPGAESERILAALNETDCTAKYILLTHGHADHMSAANDVVAKTGAKLCVPEGDKDFINRPSLNCYDMLNTSAFVALRPDIILHDGETVNFGNTELKVLATPGHTEGSVCFIGNDSMFCGDTVFKEGVGRTDLPSGSSQKLMASLKKIASIDGNLQILPGHGEFTTLSYEKANNPYLNLGA